MTVDDLLQTIRDKAIMITQKKLGKNLHDVTVLTVTILSQIYSLEYLMEELLRTLDRLGKIAKERKT